MHKLLIFNDEKLLLRALTHRSYVNENFEESGHNERLEFLGDAILNFISGEYLYQHYTEMGEDEMTRRRAAFVDEKQLSRFATEIGLYKIMRLGEGANKEGGRHNPNLLSCTFEAVVGAYYLDHNRDIEILRPLIEELFESVPQEIVEIRSSIDFKNKLQAHAQAKKISLRYDETEKTGGSDNSPEYSSKVYLDEKLYGEGKGRKKKDAEKNAAAAALSKLKRQGLI